MKPNSAACPFSGTTLKIGAFTDAGPDGTLRMCPTIVFDGQPATEESRTSGQRGAEIALPAKPSGRSTTTSFRSCTLVEANTPSGPIRNPLFTAMRVVSAYG